VLIAGLNALFFFRLPLSQASKQTGLSCVAAAEIGRWATEKAVSKPESAAETSFAQKAVSRFIELADSNRLLFLASEVAEAESKGVAWWRGFVGSQDCGPFNAWLSATHLKGNQRLLRILKEIDFSDALPPTLPLQAPSEEDSVPWYSAFAKDEAELKQRIAKVAKAVGSSSTQHQLDAFGGNRREMLAFSLARFLVDEEPLEANAVLARAYLSTLDPFSDYFSKEEYADFYRDLSGGASGVGLRLRDLPTGLLVQTVLQDSPAGKSKKVFPGDVIVRVDGSSLAGLSSRSLRHSLEGRPGTKIILTLAGRRGKPQRDVVLVREPFAFEDSRVTSKLMGTRRVGVVTIPSFYGRGGKGEEGERSSAEDLEVVLKDLMKRKPSAVVLDLRGNPGGYLEESVAMAGFFLGSKAVVAVVEPTMQRIMSDHHQAPLYNGPLVVLVDDQSASASEVLAGALKDYQRALILGSPRTYGKGSVQRLYPLDSGLLQLSPRDSEGAVKLTTSFFYSPLGTSPASGGIAPHVALDEMPKKGLEESDKKPRRTQEAPKQSAFVDGTTLNQIRLRESTMSERVRALKESAPADGKLEPFDRALEMAGLWGSLSADDSPPNDSRKKTVNAEAPMVLYK
jgi:C-terminal peptidase prc